MAQSLLTELVARTSSDASLMNIFSISGSLRQRENSAQRQLFAICELLFTRLASFAILCFTRSFPLRARLASFTFFFIFRLPVCHTLHIFSPICPFCLLPANPLASQLAILACPTPSPYLAASIAASSSHLASLASPCSSVHVSRASPSPTLLHLHAPFAS